MNRRLGVIFLTIALGVILLFNGVWFYGHSDEQPSSLGSSNEPIRKPSPSQPKHGVAPAQPELPPQVDPKEEELLFDTSPNNAAKLEDEVGHSVPAPGDHDSVDWSQFAYVQYITATEHVCNSLMVFEALHRLGSKADRVLLYPQEWGEVGGPDWKNLAASGTKLMLRAQDSYHVKLKPVNLIVKSGDERTWEAGFTKLLAFNQTDYKRTMMFDNDATVLKHLDHLFLLPPTPLALPRAYWLLPDPLPEKTVNKYILSAQLLVITPDPVVFDALVEAVRNKGRNDYDMEIINWVLGPMAMVLPHRALNLLSGEFRGGHKPGYKGYHRYLGITGEPWDAKKVLDEAYYVHFSDWPRPKPWYQPHEDKMAELTPKCYPKTPTAKGYDSRRGRLRRDEKDMDCSDKEAWLWLYSDFKDRRKNLCGLDLLPPPA